MSDIENNNTTIIEEIPTKTYENEIWKPIVGHSLYEISNCGRVRHIKKGTLIKAFKNNGSSNIDIYHDDKKTKTQYPLRKLIASHFLPIPENKNAILRYKNNTKKENTADNLYYFVPKPKKVKKIVPLDGQSNDTTNN